jgi:hypothetical protein
MDFLEKVLLVLIYTGLAMLPVAFALVVLAAIGLV